MGIFILELIRNQKQIPSYSIIFDLFDDKKHFASEIFNTARASDCRTCVLIKQVSF